MQQATHYLLPEKLKTLSNELFLCVCCFSPKRVSFSKNFGEEDPIAPFSFKTPGPWEPGRSLYLGVAMDAEGAAGAGGKPVELFFHEFQQDVFDEVFFWL